MLTMKSARICVLLLLAATLPVLQFAQVSTANGSASKGSRSGDSEPSGQGSMVGYIDDAIVGSQVRIRCDAAFGDTQPDLAEFFQAEAKYDATQVPSTPAGPGPGLAIKENFQQLYMRGEYAPVDRLSFILEVPLRWVQPILFAEGTTTNGAWGSQGGLSDVSAGFKIAVQESERDSLTLQFLASFPSGDADKGLGAAHYAIVPAILDYQKLSDRFSLESELSDSHPIGGDTPGFAADVLEFGSGPGYVAYRSDRIEITPVVEFVGWKIFGGHWSNPQLIDPNDPNYPQPCPTGTNPCFDSADGHIINLKGGFRTTIGDNTSFYVGYGHVLTNANLWYNQILRIEYRRTF